MLYFSKLKIIFIYILIIFLSYFTILNFLSPNYKFSNKKINLGLDLQGGSYLLLEVDSNPIVVQKLQNKFSDLKGYLNTKRPNDVVSIKLKVGTEEKTVSVKLNKNERVQFYLIGILKNLNSDELKKYNINSGVKISEFNNNSFDSCECSSSRDFP